MKFRLSLFIAFVGQCLIVHSDRISLIGSYYVQSESTYDVFVATSQLNSSSQINVSFGTSKLPITRTIKNDRANSIEKMQFAIPAGNSTNFELKISHTINRKCSQKSIKLVDASEQSIIFIYFDKPIYRTGEEFNFKVILLDEKMIPKVSHSPMDVTIFDSKSIAVRTFRNAETTNYGIFADSLKIAEKPNVGRWKIQVNVNERKVTKIFEVHHPVEENFEVLVDIPEAVAYADRKVFMGITIKDQLFNFFTGTATISVSGRFQNSDREMFRKIAKTLDIEGNKKILNLDYENEIGISFATKDMLLIFKVEVTCKITKRVTKAIKEVRMRYKGKNDIQLIRKKYFKPSLKYPVKIRVKTLDGRLDNSFNQLKMTVTYENRNTGNQKLTKDEKSFSVNLKNGETLQQLQPTVQTEKITIDLEFAGTKLTETIDPLPTYGLNEYLEVKLINKSSKVGDKVKVAVKTTADELGTLHVLIFGMHGLVNSKEYPQAEGMDIFDFTVELTEQMKPECRGLVFYVRDGVIIFDEFSLVIGVSIDNSLEIFVDENQLFKPNQPINLEVETRKGSMVFLSAIDHNSALFGRDNEISRTDIYNELVYYINRKFPKISSYEFEKLNAFILEPLENGDFCDGSPRNNAIEVENQTEIQTVGASNAVNTYFPDVWLDHQYEAGTDKIKTFTPKLPNDLVTWKIFGVSVHPKKGFTVTKAHTLVAVKSEIVINIHAPSFIYETELFTVNVSALNTLENHLNAKLGITIDNGVLVKEESYEKHKLICRTFTPTDRDYTNFARFQLPAGRTSLTQRFLIRSTGKGDITFKVTAEINNYNTEASKIIKVEKFSDKIQKIAQESRLITNSSPMKFEEFTELNKKENANYFISVYGNLLGPAINGLDTIFDTPLITDEDRISKFATAIISYKYLESINHSKHIKGYKALNDMLEGYQEVVAISEKIMSTRSSKSIWLAAYIADTLIDAANLIEIDEKYLTGLLDFIMNQQKQDGSFSYDPDSDHHRDIAPAVRPQLYTAFIIAPFLKDPNIKEHYKIEIANSMKYFFSKTESFYEDYGKAFTAYMWALNKYDGYSREWIQALKRGFESPAHEKHTSIYVEIISYTILAKLMTKDDAKNEVSWLIKYKNANGDFYSPYHTVLALKAIYEYVRINEPQSTQLEIIVNGQKKGKTLQNKLDFEIIKLSDQDQTVRVFGQGLAYASLFYKIHEIKIEEKRNFIARVSLDPQSENVANFKLDIELSGMDITTPNLVLAQVELPRGYKFMEHDENKNIVDMKYNKDKNSVVILINKIEKNKAFSNSFRILKIYEIENHEKAAVTVYDYYRPNIKDTTIFKHDMNFKNCKDIESLELERIKNIMERTKTDLEKIAQSINAKMTYYKDEKKKEELRKKAEKAEEIDSFLEEEDKILSNIMKLYIKEKNEIEEQNRMRQERLLREQQERDRQQEAQSKQHQQEKVDRKVDSCKSFFRFCTFGF